MDYMMSKAEWFAEFGQYEKQDERVDAIVNELVCGKCGKKAVGNNHQKALIIHEDERISDCCGHELTEFGEDKASDLVAQLKQEIFFYESGEGFGSGMNLEHGESDIFVQIKSSLGVVMYKESPEKQTSWFWLMIQIAAERSARFYSKLGKVRLFMLLVMSLPVLWIFARKHGNRCAHSGVRITSTMCGMEMGSEHEFFTHYFYNPNRAKSATPGKGFFQGQIHKDAQGQRAAALRANNGSIHGSP